MTLIHLDNVYTSVFQYKWMPITYLCTEYELNSILWMKRWPCIPVFHSVDVRWSVHQCTSFGFLSLPENTDLYLLMFTPTIYFLCLCADHLKGVPPCHRLALLVGYQSKPRPMKIHSEMFGRSAAPFSPRNQILSIGCSRRTDDPCATPAGPREAFWLLGEMIT